MQYIVLDLEWNQSPTGKKNTVSEIPFEIIQIGAVKLDSNFNIIDEFNMNIRPYGDYFSDYSTDLIQYSK